MTALIALGIVEAYELQHGVDLLEVEHNSTIYLHVLIEALRLAFADSELPTSKSVADVQLNITSPTRASSTSLSQNCSARCVRLFSSQISGLRHLGVLDQTSCLDRPKESGSSRARRPDQLYRYSVPVYRRQGRQRMLLHCF